MADTRFIYFAIPEDPYLLQKLGEVSLYHTNLDHMLRMTIKSLANLSVDDALDATERTSSSALRERIRKLARQRFGEGEVLLKLEAILERCQRATAKRNELIHSIVGHELDKEPLMRRSGNKWGPLPTVEDLHALTVELFAVAGEVHNARRHGFLHEALEARKAP